MPYFHSSHSSTLSNPCPDGTGIGYGEWNGTIFVICDAAFAHSSGGGDPLALGLGLGLGLGLPFLCIVSGFLTRYCTWSYRSQTVTNFKTDGMVVPSRVDVSQSLSEKANTDLCFDNLSEELKTELMVLRLQKGRNLDEFAAKARGRKALTVAAWIDQMNPGQFPFIIRQMAAQRRDEEKAEEPI